jgi:predicted kinase
MSATLHLICGLPGAGKSTLARRLATETGALRLASDVWMKRLGADGYDTVTRAAVEALQWELAVALLARGESVILEAGFWTRAERDACREGAAAVGAGVRLHVCDAPVAELQRRLAARNASPDDESYVVDPADLAEWDSMFERPGPEELGG